MTSSFATRKDDTGIGLQQNTEGEQSARSDAYK
jgi:hypothetical protein